MANEQATEAAMPPDPQSPAVLPGVRRAARLVCDFTDDTRAMGESSQTEIGTVADVIQRELGLDELAEAIQVYMDEQNGPPLLRRESQWHAADARLRAALARLTTPSPTESK